MIEAGVEHRTRASTTFVAPTDLIVICGAVLALSGLAIEITQGGLASDISLAAVSGFAAVALWMRWWRDRRLNVLLTASGVTVWSLGQISWLVMKYGLDHPVWPGPAEVGFALFPLMIGGALVGRFGQFSSLRRLALISDAALMGASLAFVAWEMGIRDGTAGTSMLVRLVLIGIPFAEIAVASLALVMYVQERSGTLGLACVGMYLLAAADTLSAARAGDPENWTRVAAIAGWSAGFVVIGAIAGRRTRPFVELNPRPAVRRVAVVYLPAMVAVLVAVAHYLVGRSPSSTMSVGLALTYVAALGSNQFIRSWESSSFANRLTTSLAELSSAETQLRTLLDDLPHAVVVLDGEGTVREVNRLSVELLNRPVEQLLGTHFTEFIRPDHLDQVVTLWVLAQDHAEEDDVPASVRIALAEPANGLLRVELDVTLPLRDPDRVVVTLRDVTRLEEESLALERVRERFRLAFHEAPIGMVLLTVATGVMLDVNASFADMLGLSVDELVGTSVQDVTHPDDWGLSDTMMRRATEGSTQSYRLEKRYLRADGSIVWARLSVSILDDDVIGSLGISHVEDITEQRRSAERLRWAATHDELTRLPNRARFMSALTEQLESSTETGTTAVLFIDLDNFKVVNDSLGHATGDQLLRGMTERLRSTLREHDMLSRFGGDEFTVMLTDCSKERSPKSMAERLRNEISRPLLIEGVELFVTGSIGIALATSSSSTATELLRDADAAMYRAKARGRDCVETFAPGVRDASVLALRTGSELRRGVERDEIVPYYQPIIDLSTGVLTGFEVLARWRHPSRGLLGADQFLPMAEETGLINEVGASILRSSLVQLGRWRDRLPGFGNLSIAVNVSGRQLLNPEFVDIVGDALAEAGVPAGSLWLEITETALMTDVKAASVALRELRSIGLHLSVDDFGTGYSSLTYLKRFPVEVIKVDRSFVNGLGIDAEDSTIVEAVINLGHSLGLGVVAEGVETPLQLTRLRELGCDRAQGYLFGRPRPAEIIEAERSTV